MWLCAAKRVAAGALAHHIDAEDAAINKWKRFVQLGRMIFPQAS